MPQETLYTLPMVLGLLFSKLLILMLFHCNTAASISHPTQQLDQELEGKKWPENKISSDSQSVSDVIQLNYEQTRSGVNDGDYKGTRSNRHVHMQTKMLSSLVSEQGSVTENAVGPVSINQSQQEDGVDYEHNYTAIEKEIIFPPRQHHHPFVTDGQGVRRQAINIPEERETTKRKMTITRPKRIIIKRTTSPLFSHKNDKNYSKGNADISDSDSDTIDYEMTRETPVEAPVQPPSQILLNLNTSQRPERTGLTPQCSFTYDSFMGVPMAAVAVVATASLSAPVRMTTVSCLVSMTAPVTITISNQKIPSKFSPDTDTLISSIPRDADKREPRASERLVQDEEKVFTDALKYLSKGASSSFIQDPEDAGGGGRASIAMSVPLMPIRREKESVSSISILHGPQVGMSRERILINCACDTRDCISGRQRTCKTYEMCYTQSLPTRDGTATTARGCISGSTPLLCENRRPKIVSLWPVLNCCKTDMCNADGKPSFRHSFARDSTTPKPYPVTYVSSAITLVWNKTVYESEPQEGGLRNGAESTTDFYEVESVSDGTIEGNGSATGGLDTGSKFPELSLHHQRYTTDPKYNSANSRTAFTENANSLELNHGMQLQLAISHPNTTASRKKNIRHRNSKSSKVRHSPVEKQDTNEKESGDKGKAGVTDKLKEKFLATLLNKSSKDGGDSTFSERNLPKISPIATGFLIGGAIIIIIISAVGFCILKKEQQQSRTFIHSTSACSYRMAPDDPDIFLSADATNLRCEEPEDRQSPEEGPALMADWNESNSRLPNETIVARNTGCKTLPIDSNAVSDSGVTPTSILSSEAFIIHEIRSENV